MITNDPTEDVSDAADDPCVQWRDDAVPYSSRFGDTYFSDVDGRAETREVFLGGNDLPARWGARDENNANTFVVAELGFGTGLNFLETVAAWRRCGPRDATLRFVSFERFPMAQSDLMKALSAWPDLLGLAEAFLSGWGGSVDRDAFRVTVDDVALEVHLGDARRCLPEAGVMVDAWYLDGFSPAQNPELWELELLARVAGSTRPGGTYSTYTAAGWVRRNLQAAGFTAERVPGFGRKRERLQGMKPAAV